MERAKQLSFRKKFPNGVLIAEWFNPKQSIEGGFDIDFLQPGHLFSQFQRGSEKNTCQSIADKAGEGDIVKWYNDFKDQYESTLNRKGYIFLPTGNHDSPRIASSSRNDVNQLKVAMTFLLTLPGVPFIYYGDEIGMKYIPKSPDVEGSRTRSGPLVAQCNGMTSVATLLLLKQKIYIFRKTQIPTVRLLLNTIRIRTLS